MFLLALLILVRAQNKEEFQKNLGACWLLTIRDINRNTDAMTTIIESVPEGNKTAIYYKVQMNMIFNCMDLIDSEKSGQYLRDEASKYVEVVPAHQYSAFIGTDLTLNSHDLHLLDIIKDLEKGMSDLQKANILSKKRKVSQQIEEEWQQAIFKSETQPVKQQEVIPVGPGMSSYVIFTIIMALLFGGGFLLIQYIRKIDVNKKGKSNKCK